MSEIIWIIVAALLIASLAIASAVIFSILYRNVCKQLDEYKKASDNGKARLSTQIGAKNYKMLLKDCHCGCKHCPFVACISSCEKKKQEIYNDSIENAISIWLKEKYKNE